MSPPLTNCYEILNCDPSDSIDEIKKSYQALILTHHPDKQCTSDQTNAIGDSIEFHKINEAWKLLRDPEKKKKYDAELQQQNFDSEPIVYEKVTRNAFDFDSESQSYLYPCRCGGYFTLPDDCIEPNQSENDSNSKSTNSHDNDDDSIYIECDECSLVLELYSNHKGR